MVPPAPIFHQAGVEQVIDDSGDDDDDGDEDAGMCRPKRLISLA